MEDEITQLRAIRGAYLHGFAFQTKLNEFHVIHVFKTIFHFNVGLSLFERWKEMEKEKEKPIYFRFEISFSYLHNFHNNSSFYLKFSEIW